PRADAHALDHVDGRGQAEVVAEVVAAVDQITVRAARIIGQLRHGPAPGALFGVGVVLEKAGLDDRACGLLEVTHRNRAKAILAMNDLALLGHAQAPADRADRGGQHGARSLAAAAAHSAAAAV